MKPTLPAINKNEFLCIIRKNLRNVEKALRKVLARRFFSISLWHWRDSGGLISIQFFVSLTLSPIEFTLLKHTRLYIKCWCSYYIIYTTSKRDTELHFNIYILIFFYSTSNQCLCKWHVINLNIKLIISLLINLFIIYYSHLLQY